MEKKIIALKKNDNTIHNNGGPKEIKPKFDTMEQLNNWVFDLSETERKKQETAKEISDNLQYFVDQKNKKAI